MEPRRVARHGSLSNRVRRCRETNNGANVREERVRYNSQAAVGGEFFHRRRLI